MKSFTDNLGRAWTVEITVGTLRRVKAALGLNLLQVADGFVEQLLHDPVEFVDILYEVCRPKAEAKQIDADSFGRGMKGDPLQQAFDAFLEEMIDFFHSGKRRALMKVLAKSRELETRSIARAESLVESPELEAQIVAALEEIRLPTPGTPSGSSPASSASTPTPTPGSNST